MRFTVEQWAPEYGQSVEGDLVPSQVEVDLDVETRADEWRPVVPSPVTVGGDVVFVDGVRRIDARLWIEDDAAGMHRPGIFASFAAGAVRCGTRAVIEEVSIGRRLYAAAPSATDVDTVHGAYEMRRCAGDDPEVLSMDLQRDMAELEARTAANVACGDRDLAIVDGPLRAGHDTVESPERLVGYIKTHHRSYLPDDLTRDVVGVLRVGERSPLFVTGGRRTSFSWYVRLPGGNGHPLSGVVRCELSATAGVERARDIADRVTNLVPRYASTPHKDSRAPQNLHPIAGLERRLRDRLGDPAILLRSLLRASSG